VLLQRPVAGAAVRRPNHDVIRKDRTPVKATTFAILAVCAAVRG
jgi:hypothetical protein